MANASRSPKHSMWLRQFFASEAAGGAAMLAATLLAIVLANSQYARVPDAFFHTPWIAGMDGHRLILDGLMPIFFLMVGMELKHEMLHGALASTAQRVLPLIAALGGIVAPAAIFMVTTYPNYPTGWAIPTATDIAFAVCVVNLFGNAVPQPAKIFLLAIAIYDDLAAILIIALFYSGSIGLLPLLAAALTIGGMVLLNRRNHTTVFHYLLLGAVLGLLLHAAGIHSTVAGMVTGLCLPLPTLHRLMPRLHRWVAFAILPLFALASAGIDLRGFEASNLLHPLTSGIAIALFIGKPLGIFMATYAAIKTGYASQPTGAAWPLLFALSMIAGIGFTMSLFIGQLAFSGDAVLQRFLVLGVMSGSLFSAVFGGLLLARSLRR